MSFVPPSPPSAAAAASTANIDSLRQNNAQMLQNHLQQRVNAETAQAMKLKDPQQISRQQQLEQARGIIAKYRAPETPVGIVTNGYRPGQVVTVTDLAHVLEHDIGMNTTVIIGNSTTFSLNGWMVTPRGYHRKYKLGAK